MLLRYDLEIKAFSGLTYFPSITAKWGNDD